MSTQTNAIKIALEAYMAAGFGNSTNFALQGKAYDLAVEALAEQPAPVQQEPVAWLFQHEETGLTQCVDAQQVEWGFEKNNPRWQKIAPLYTTPQAQRKPLTVDQIRGIYEDCDAPTSGLFTIAFARAIEADHGIKENT